MLWAAAAVAAPLPLASQAVAAGQIDPETSPRPSLQARRANAAITLDGNLNEAVWALADSTRSVFYQSIPAQGVPSAERTVVRVLYDDERFYIGATMYDSQPNALVSAGLEQDFATQDSDIFGFALDTYLDRQNAFLFAVNPAGALFDAQAFNDQQSVNRAWEGEVEVSTRITDFGWVAEIAVPMTTRDRRSAELGDQLLAAHQANFRGFQLGTAHAPVSGLQDVTGRHSDVDRGAGAGPQPVDQAVR